MFEAKITAAKTLKDIVGAIKGTVTEVSFRCSERAMSVSAFDNNHETFVSVQLNREGFEEYRCDRNITLGMNLNRSVKIIRLSGLRSFVPRLSKILKCAANDDSVLIKAANRDDKVSLTFKSKKLNEETEYIVKLVDVELEPSVSINLSCNPSSDSCFCSQRIAPDVFHLAITMPARRFQRICRDLSKIGDSVTITFAKDSVEFRSTGDTGSVGVLLKETISVDPKESVKIFYLKSVSHSYKLDRLIYCSKATLLAAQVKLSLSPNGSLFVEYTMTEGVALSDEVGHIRYHFAPNPPIQSKTISGSLQNC